MVSRPRPVRPRTTSRCILSPDRRTAGAPMWFHARQWHVGTRVRTPCPRRERVSDRSLPYARTSILA
jgi:hypothetical protein